MKVGDAIKQKEAVDKIFKNLQNLERLFENNLDLDKNVVEMAEISDMSVEKILTEARMLMYDKMSELDRRINNSELLD